MFVVIVVMAGIVLFTALTVGVLPLYEVFHNNNSQIIAGEIAAIQRAVNDKAIDNVGDFYTNGYSFPTEGAGGINALTDENRYLHFLNYERYKHSESFFNYYNSPSSIVRSHRFAMWFESPFGNFLGEDYTKAGFNKCGSGAVGDSQQWCGDNRSLWTKLESHTGHYDLIQSEQHRLYRLSRKFYRYYERNGSFSDFGVSTNALVDLVDGGPLDGGMPILAHECSGDYYFKGIPLGCNELFNAWGGAIYLHSIGDNYIALTNSLGIELVQADGSASKYVGLAEEINIDEITLMQP